MSKGIAVQKALWRKGDMIIPGIAERLGRSYTWVYVRVRKLKRSEVYVYRGVIYVRRDGVDRLAGMSVRAPRTVGRPRKTVV